MAASTQERHDHPQEWGLLRGVVVAALAALTAAGACAAVFGIASALGGVPDDVAVTGPGGEGPLTLGTVVSAATITTTWAATVFALFARFSSEPLKRFRATALGVFVLSLATPFAISGAPASMIATLLVMHALVAAISVGAFTVLLPPR